MKIKNLIPLFSASSFLQKQKHKFLNPDTIKPNIGKFYELLPITC